VARVWKELGHPNIVRFLDVVETNKYIFVVCDLCDGGRLYDYVVGSPEGYLPEEQARYIFRQVMEALCYLHGRSLMHGDIKLDNLLVGEKLNVKLCDFGFSDALDANLRRITPQGKGQAPCGGTLVYCAPEVLRGSEEIGAASDVWSAGVTLFAMAGGELPFDDDYEPRLKHLILSGRLSFPEEPEFSDGEHHFSFFLSSFFSSPLRAKKRREKESRKFNGNCNSNSKRCPWSGCSNVSSPLSLIIIFPELKDLISKMLTVNVKERLTVEQVLAHPWFS
jgi:serine/threonine protein kinase